MDKHSKKIIQNITKTIVTITVAAASVLRAYDYGVTNTQKNTIKKLEGNIISGDTVTINQSNEISDTYEELTNEVLDELKTFKEENASLKKEILDLQNDKQEKKSEDTKGIEDATEAGEEQEENSQRVDEYQPGLQVVSIKDSNAYEAYNGNGNNGFIMFGNTYTNGFTFLMAASYNMWGHEEQYAIFNIEDAAKEYSVINMLAGHIDEYASDSVEVYIFLDKTIDDGNADYYFEIQPELKPQEIEINISGKSSMVVEVKNQGGDFNKIGFANPTFYK